MRKLIFIILPLLFLSCVTFRPYTDFKSGEFSEPQVGTVTTKNIGEALVKQGTLYSGKVVVIPKTMAWAEGIVQAGTYKATATRRKSVSNQNTGRTTYKDIIIFKGVGLSASGGYFSTDCYLEYDETNNNLSYVWVGGSRNLPQGHKKIENFEVKYGHYPTPDSFQQTLYYLGKSGNTLRLGYREFYDDMARPNFSNEVTYDLSESNIIGYQNARIKVIEATNVSIKYELINAF